MPATFQVLLAGGQPSVGVVAAADYPDHPDHPQSDVLEAPGDSLREPGVVDTAAQMADAPREPDPIDEAEADKAKGEVAVSRIFPNLDNSAPVVPEAPPETPATSPKSLFSNLKAPTKG